MLIYYNKYKDYTENNMEPNKMRINLLHIVSSSITIIIYDLYIGKIYAKAMYSPFIAVPDI